MKKYLFIVSLFGVFLLAWCWNQAVDEKSVNTDVDTWVETAEQSNEDFGDTTPEGTIISYIIANNSCDDQSKTFANIALLWEKSLGDWLAERYVVTQAEWFYIDERWNLNNSCGFSIPMKIVTSCDDGIHYTVMDAVQARDWNEYDISLKEMFSEEAIDRLYSWNYEFWDWRTLLEMAEEYFGVTIIPETENNFECKFCDKLWYYEPLQNEDGKSNDLIFNYVSEDNWNNTIYFGSDWSFKAEWSRDAWEWTRTFWQDENTVIVSDSNADHVYSRYIIDSVDETNLNTILEIIQRK